MVEVEASVWWMHERAAMLFRERHRHAVLFLSLASLAACGRREDRAQTPASPSKTEATTNASSTPATEAPAAKPPVSVSGLPSPKSDAEPPPSLRRVQPKSVTASSFLAEAKPRASWTPQLAVDRQSSTAWRAEGDAPAWIEFTFDKPTKLWAVRSDAGWVQAGQLDKHARAKRVVLRVDDEDLYELSVDRDGRVADFPAIDREVRRVRLSYPEVWPGPAGSTLAIGEVTFFADASTFPSVPVRDVDAEVEEVLGDDAVSKAKALLLRFGVTPSGSLTDARAALLPTSGEIKVLKVTYDRDQGKGAAFVFLGIHEVDRMRRYTRLDAEVVEEPGIVDLDADFEAVHSRDGIKDLAIRYRVEREGKPTRHGLRVISVARNAPERIAEFLDERTPGIDTDSTGDGGYPIVLTPAEGSTKPIWRLRFDEGAFRYL